jgi:hypothetical protein
MKNKIQWHKISFISSMVIGSSLFLLGAYFAIISFATMGVDNGMKQIKQGITLEDGQLEDLIKTQTQAAGIAGSGVLYEDLALAEMTLAEDYGFFSKDGRQLLESAQAHLHKGVELSPARSIGWYRLAYVKIMLVGSSKEVSDIVYMAILTAPYDYRALPKRLQMAMMSWKYFNGEQKDVIYQQIRIGWQKNKWDILRLAKAEGVRPIILEDLKNSEEDKVEFEKAIGGKKL